MEKRQYSRNSIEPLEIVIELLEYSHGKYENVTVFINDVSIEGMRFTTKVSLNTNEIIKFHLPSLHIESLITGRIAWKQELETSRYLYGLQILQSS